MKHLPFDRNLIKEVSVCDVWRPVSRSGVVCFCGSKCWMTLERLQSITEDKISEENKADQVKCKENVCSFLCSHINCGVHSLSTELSLPCTGMKHLPFDKNLIKRSLSVWCMAFASSITLSWCTVRQFPFSFLLFKLAGQDSIVSKATCYGLGVSDFEPRWGQEIWSSSHPSSILYNGYRGSFIWVKLLGHGVDHLPWC